MNRYAFVVGRSSAVCLEELLSVVRSSAHIEDVTPEFLIARGELDPSSLLQILGGTIKICRVVDERAGQPVPTKDEWLHWLRSEVSEATGKFSFGASVYGPQSVMRNVIREGLTLKKHLKTIGRPSRFVYDAGGRLSSVSVTKNHLLGRELVLLHGKQWYAAITEAVQDFEAYGARDVGRPKRDMRRGMLPPKVAQIMLNLARVTKDDRFLDPFCGSGTILQEALLRGVTDVTGTDSDLAAVSAAKENIAWLSVRYKTPPAHVAVSEIAHIANTLSGKKVTAVVTEPYLGPARELVSAALTRASLDTILRELNALYHASFLSLAGLMESGGRLVIILPVIRALGSAHTVGNLPAYEKIGFRLQKPAITSVWSEAPLSPRGQLMYEREDQVVAREITVWERL